MVQDTGALLEEIRACTLCAAHLPLEPRPILQAHRSARILIAGQAPGRITHHKGRPFDDPSGVRLREWLGVGEAEFYDPERFAIVPMGFCFPGYDAKGGDKPPIKRCAATWRAELLQELPNISLTLLIGKYAQNWHFPETRNQSLRSIVMEFDHYLDKGVLPMPHTSWRNNRWLKQNPWFDDKVLPELRRRIRTLLS